ncbi:T9SS type A sorting domain-containing protein [bacterium]|nr:T9SS type A sorting domain-containing protein [bacterium]
MHSIIQTVFIAILALSNMFMPATAQSILEKREYEPVVIKGGILQGFYENAIEDLHLYAFKNGQWQKMPFQIDEYAQAIDEFRLPDTTYRWSHFYPDNGMLDDSDELAFMLRDMGEQVSGQEWIEDQESRRNNRLEIRIFYEDADDDIAYAYLYKSNTITEATPRPYNLVYSKETHSVSSSAYSLRLDAASGVIRDINIHPPFGSGEDIFDTQKMRFVGLMDLAGIILPIGRLEEVNAANERDVLYVFPESDTENYFYQYSSDPVVRIIRDVRQTIRFGSFILPELAFYVEAKFYPYSGAIDGGVSLDPDTLKKYFGNENEIYIEMDILRQSWDFSPQAAGMTYHNPYNRDVVVDGIPDTVNTQLDIPVSTWGLTTGDQGSVFTHTTFKDTGWQNIQLYYRDDINGGQSDGTWIDSINGDTGDGQSFGDYGTLFENLSQRAVDLNLGFVAYFIPGNMIWDDGLLLHENILNPVIVDGDFCACMNGVDDPDNRQPDIFMLHQNYPNPFNGQTVIPYELSGVKKIRISIYNASGRLVRTLHDGYIKAGRHELYWDGYDNKNDEASSGVYFVHMQSGDHTALSKLLLLR